MQDQYNLKLAMATEPYDNDDDKINQDGYPDYES